MSQPKIDRWKESKNYKKLLGALDAWSSDKRIAAAKALLELRDEKALDSMADIVLKQFKRVKGMDRMLPIATLGDINTMRSTGILNDILRRNVSGHDFNLILEDKYWAIMALDETNFPTLVANCVYNACDEALFWYNHAKAYEKGHLTIASIGRMEFISETLWGEVSRHSVLIICDGVTLLGSLGRSEEARKLLASKNMKYDEPKKWIELRLRS